MKLPIKTRILEWAIEKNAPFTTKDVASYLSKEYPGERTTTAKQIDKQLEMFSRVGMMKAVDVALDEADKLQVTYQITKTGRETEKYIPGHGNKVF